MPAFSRRSVEVNGRSVSYIESGEGEDVLVLFHGAIVWCSADIEFGEVLPILGRNLRVIAPDVLGYGENPGRGPEDYHSADLAAFAVAFIRALGVRAFVGGNSHGGWLATYCALELPDLVRGLVVINSGSTVIAHRPESGPDRYDPRWAVPARSPSLDDIRNELAAFYRQPQVVSEARVARTHELAVRHFEFAIARQRAQGATSNDRNRELSYRGRHIFWAVDQLTMPVLITWSRENRGCSPEQAMPFFNRLQNAEMHTWVDAGHHLQLEHPERWSSVVLDFIQSH
jgi:pimeloyl-ACP methyl ester carboxylesterase